MCNPVKKNKNKMYYHTIEILKVGAKDYFLMFWEENLELA